MLCFPAAPIGQRHGERGGSAQEEAQLSEGGELVSGAGEQAADQRSGGCAARDHQLQVKGTTHLRV